MPSRHRDSYLETANAAVDRRGYDSLHAARTVCFLGPPGVRRRIPSPRKLVLFFQNEFPRIFPTGAALSPASASRLSFQEQELLSF